MTHPILSLEGVYADIGEYHILHDINLAIPEGGVHVLLGRNGAGKTTTLRTIMGLCRTIKGSVTFRGRDITRMHISDIAQLGVAFVPENMGIFGGLTVAENMALATKNGRFDDKRLQNIFAIFPAMETFWTKPAFALSGGQKQMLAISRAIIEHRDLILIDEPTKGLAPAIIRNMIAAFQQIGTDTTVLLVEQNFHFASALGQTVAVIDDGHIVHRGTMADLTADPALQERFLSLSLEAH